MLIGVTGNFCSGKSTLLGFFSSMGYRTLDSDEIVDKLYRDKKILARIRKLFGAEAVKKGRVDKKALARIVFGDRKKLQKLESVVHPLAKKEIRRTGHKGKIVFVEAPLLFEAGFEELFDYVILVKCTRQTAEARAKARGFHAWDFRKRVARQWHAKRKAEKTDFVVDSECPKRELGKSALALSGFLARRL